MRRETNLKRDRIEKILKESKQRERKRVKTKRGKTGLNCNGQRMKSPIDKVAIF